MALDPSFVVFGMKHSWCQIIFVAGILATSCCGMSAAQRLSISPRGTQIKTIDAGMIFTCTLPLDDESPGGGAEGGPGLQGAWPGGAGGGNPRLQWKGPGQRNIVATSGRVYVERGEDPTSLRLYITKIEESDAGIYTCTASLQGGDQISEETKMFLYEDIQFVATPLYERHVLGSSPLLHCSAAGQPSPVVSWRFNRRRILADSGKYALEEGGLRIRNLDLRDNGTYECRAEVESHGNVKIRLVTIDVLYPPVILKAPTADMIIEGRNATLECRAAGNPPVHYEWFREQKMSELIRAKARLAEGVEMYTIGSVAREDEGRYFCRVSNDFGTKEAFVDLKMLIPPMILSLPSRVILHEGANFNLSCEAAGVPVPKIVWTKLPVVSESTMSESQLRVSRIWHENTQPGVNTLILRNVQRGYAGNLSCSAENPVGVTDKTVAFVVEYAPSISLVVSEQLGWAGQTRNFTCVARGLPRPTLVWYHGDQYISGSDEHLISTIRTDVVTSTLSIKIGMNKPWIYGGYSCMAKNPIGHMAEQARLDEAFVPDTPRNVSVVEETPTSVTLVITPPSRPRPPDGRGDGLPIIGWTLKHEAVGHGGKGVKQEFTGTESLVVKDLTPDTTYTFYLSASNVVGSSQPIKFRVTTPRRSAVKEQLDFPSKEGDEESPIPDDHSADTKPDSAQSRDVTGDNILADGSLLTENGSAVLGIAVGSLLVVMAVMLAILCGVVWRRRKQHGYVTSAQLSLGRPSQNCVVLQQMPRRPDDPLPDVAVGGESAGVQQGVTSYGSIKRNNRVTTPTMQRSGTSTFVAPRVQQQEWDRMLAVEALRHDDVMMTSLASSGGELPPPPAFLLDGERNHLAHAGRMNSRTGAGGSGSRVEGGLFMDEILDGYISGDNVDDDIDQVDFTIRMPSIHNKLCDI